MTTKTTKKENFMELYAIVETMELDETKKDSLLAFIEHELDLLGRKNSHKSDKPTKKQIENEKMTYDILALLESSKYYTAKEIGEMFSLSTQKVTALLKDHVSRETYKGRTLYYIGEKPNEYPEFKKESKKGE
jgi:Fic family protein